MIFMVAASLVYVWVFTLILMSLFFVSVGFYLFFISNQQSMWLENTNKKSEEKIDQNL